MTTNVGTIDRVLRAALGLVLLGLAFSSGLPLFETALARILAGVLCLVMLVVAATRVCPIYLIFGINTRRA